MTFTASGGYAAFQYSPAASSYFYSAPLHLFAGINYSVSLWHKLSQAASNWSNLSLLLSTTQSSTSAIPIASVNSSGMSTSFTALSASFTAASSGTYYLVINGVGSPTGNAQYLIWDDLLISSPCTMNPLNVTVSSSQNTLCAGQCVTLTASGAPSYLWCNGSTSNTIQICPSAASPSCSVTGYNALSSCSVNVPQPVIAVYPSPNVSATSSPDLICTGESLLLTAFGASTYTWSNGIQVPGMVQSPSVTTIYTVSGSNNFGCQGTNTVLVNVNLCTGLNDNDELSATLFYPNPANERLGFSGLKSHDVHIEIYSELGILIRRFDLQDKNQTLNIEPLPPGTYLVQIIDAGHRTVRKLLKD